MKSSFGHAPEVILDVLASISASSCFCLSASPRAVLRNCRLDVFSKTGTTLVTEVLSKLPLLVLTKPLSSALLSSATPFFFFLDTLLRKDGAILPLASFVFICLDNDVAVLALAVSDVDVLPVSPLARETAGDLACREGVCEVEVRAGGGNTKEGDSVRSV